MSRGRLDVFRCVIASLIFALKLPPAWYELNQLSYILLRREDGSPGSPSWPCLSEFVLRGQNGFSSSAGEGSQPSQLRGASCLGRGIL